MKIAIISDIHLDHYGDKVHGLIKNFHNLNIEHADVVVVAGDITDGRFPNQYRNLFYGLKAWFKDVVMVTGNHDYYKSSFEQTHRSLAVACREVENVHFLHRSSIKLGGHTFHGHSMWYGDGPLNETYENQMNDVSQIQGLKNWVYTENRLWKEYVAQNVFRDDVVVTHHLPSPKSVAPRYISSPLNRFFVCDMEKEIENKKPALWIHGHTHDAVDYQLHDTRVVCNPRGYPRERAFGPKGYRPFYINLPDQTPGDEK